ncbi:MAG TPA: winged helix-turn-helix domain-containing protein [Candidatus Obscuribacterales bacterium]
MAENIANILRAGSVELDTVQRQVKQDGVIVRLLPIDLLLLEFFMRHPNQIFSSEELLSRVWKNQRSATNAALRASLKRIRKQLHEDPENSIIETVPYVGYRLRAFERM